MRLLRTRTIASILSSFHKQIEQLTQLAAEKDTEVTASRDQASSHRMKANDLEGQANLADREAAHARALAARIDEFIG